ncbi:MULTISPECIES: protein NO VEIN domain-containing protein [Microbacterium]|uniref:protein NO VEIN domain-containing protein n=1 Tax=Microbacterium TaxID=33882 RepID=UPI0026EDDC53|nr:MULTISPECIES: DUF3883 domain-containing protein [Microbacterium]
MNTPTDHQLRAALRVARVLDPAGNTTAEIEASLPLIVSQGEHRADDLRIGLALLLDLELAFEGATGVRSTSQLAALLTLDDPDSLRHLRRVLQATQHLTDRAQVGAAGEAAVIDACREELTLLGRADLLAKVVQVSAFDDTLGYDISAPTLRQGTRHLEVKTTSAISEGFFPFYLSRNEYDVGRSQPSEWSLVACERRGGTVTILGWCRASALTAYVPADHRGRWTEALVRIPRTVLFEGIPPCV